MNWTALAMSAATTATYHLLPLAPGPIGQPTAYNVAVHLLSNMCDPTCKRLANVRHECSRQATLHFALWPLQIWHMHISRSAVDVALLHVYRHLCCDLSFEVLLSISMSWFLPSAHDDWAHLTAPKYVVQDLRGMGPAVSCRAMGRIGLH